MSLTPNSVQSMQQLTNSNTASAADVQVLSVKKVSAASSTVGDRYRLIVSDGTNFCQAMLATQLNHFIADGQLDKFTIIRITSYVCNEIQGRNLVICLGLEIVSQATEKIGNPTSFDPSNHAQQSAPQQAAPQGQAQAQGFAQAPRQAPAQAMAKKHQASTPIYPIEGLSPYQNKWTIKARVTKKSDIKEWSNARGEGKLFSVDLMDETGEIRATGFNKAVDAFYQRLEEGKVYFISKAKVTIAKKQFSTLQNEYEITFEDSSEVELCEDDSNVPEVKFNFVPLSQLGEMQKDAVCDVLGIVREVGELGQIMAKSTQKPFSKRELTIIDRSSYSVRLTLWGKAAEAFKSQNQPVIAFRSLKISDFGGRSLSMVGGSSMVNNPDLPEAHSLRGWYDSQGHDATFATHAAGGPAAAGGAQDSLKASESITLGQVQTDNIGMNDKPDFYNAKATIVFIKQDSLWYPACRSADCNKKIYQDGDGWRCDKCNTTFDYPENRYIMSVNVEDHTGQLWLSGFNDFGLQLFGMPANDLSKIKDDSEAEFVSIINKGIGQTFQFACRAKQDTYNDTTRVRHAISRAFPIDYAAQSTKLLSLIAELERM